jgi:hypothetical protein
VLVHFSPIRDVITWLPDDLFAEQEERELGDDTAFAWNGLAERTIE